MANLPPDGLGNKKVVPILNKCDLPLSLDPLDLPGFMTQAIPISAKLGTGIARMAEAICRITGVAGLSPSTPAAFTDRQQGLVAGLSRVHSQGKALDLIEQLLHGPVQV